MQAWAEGFCGTHPRSKIPCWHGYFYQLENMWYR